MVRALSPARVQHRHDPAGSCRCRWFGRRKPHYVDVTFGASPKGDDWGQEFERFHPRGRRDHRLFEAPAGSISGVVWLGADSHSDHENGTNAQRLDAWAEASWHAPTCASIIPDTAGIVRRVPQRLGFTRVGATTSLAVLESSATARRSLVGVFQHGRVSDRAPRRSVARPVEDFDAALPAARAGRRFHRGRYIWARMTPDIRREGDGARRVASVRPLMRDGPVSDHAARVRGWPPRTCCSINRSRSACPVSHPPRS
jgi:hypothetical protein